MMLFSDGSDIMSNIFDEEFTQVPEVKKLVSKRLRMKTWSKGLLFVGHPLDIFQNNFAMCIVTLIIGIVPIWWLWFSETNQKGKGYPSPFTFNFATAQFQEKFHNNLL